MELTIADLKPFLPGLEAALDDDEVSEVMVNEPGTVFVERCGRMTALDAPELTAEAVSRAAVQIARPLGKDPLAEPIIDARHAPEQVETQEQFDEALGELLRTGRAIEAPSLDALAAWNVDLEDEEGAIEEQR